MTYRKLSRAITVVALSAAALMAFPAAASAQPGVTHQEGYAIECTGEGDGYTASVWLNENSQFGDELTVRIETADGTLLGTATDGPFLTNGTIDGVVQLAPEDDPENLVDSATVSGSYSVSGEPTRVHEVFSEGEELVITIGTRTPLTVDLTLEYAGTTIPLECDTAAAFDLMSNVRRVGTPW